MTRKYSHVYTLLTLIDELNKYLLAQVYYAFIKVLILPMDLKVFLMSRLFISPHLSTGVKLFYCVVLMDKFKKFILNNKRQINIKQINKLLIIRETTDNNILKITYLIIIYECLCNLPITLVNIESLFSMYNN